MHTEGHEASQQELLLNAEPFQTQTNFQPIINSYLPSRSFNFMCWKGSVHICITCSVSIYQASMQNSAQPPSYQIRERSRKPETSLQTQAMTGFSNHGTLQSSCLQRCMVCINGLIWGKEGKWGPGKGVEAWTCRQADRAMRAEKDRKERKTWGKHIGTERENSNSGGKQSSYMLPSPCDR